MVGSGVVVVGSKVRIVVILGVMEVLNALRSMCVGGFELSLDAENALCGNNVRKRQPSHSSKCCSVVF